MLRMNPLRNSSIQDKKNNISNGTNRALKFAFRLLKYRPRSEYELRQRLKRRGFPDPAIREAALFLKEKKFIDDCEFARLWVECRIKRPLGIIRLRQELKIKGIDKDLIEQALEQASRKYNEDDVIRDLVSRRWEKLRHIEPQKARQRLFLYLLRRGFSSAKTKEALNLAFGAMHEMQH